jgi:hypothetical protein
MALKAMSIEKLLNLKSQVEAVIASKVTEQRHALETKLSKPARFQTGKSPSKGPRGRGGRGCKDAAGVERWIYTTQPHYAGLRLAMMPIGPRRYVLETSAADAQGNPEAAANNFKKTHRLDMGSMLPSV